MPLERSPCVGHAINTASSWLTKQLGQDERNNGDLRGQDVPSHGAKDQSLPLSAATMGYINSCHRRGSTKGVMQAYFADCGDYDVVEIGRATRHLTRLNVAYFYQPRWANLLGLADDRKETLKGLLLWKVLQSLKSNQELIQFDVELSAVLRLGWYWPAWTAKQDPDTYPRVIKDMIAEMKTLLDDDDAAVAKFTVVMAELLRKGAVKAIVWGKVKEKVTSTRRQFTARNLQQIRHAAEAEVQASPPLVQAWPAAQKLRRLSRFRIGLDVLIKNFEEKLNQHMLHGRRSINFGISAISFDNYDVEDYMRRWRELLVQATTTTQEFLEAMMVVSYERRRTGLLPSWTVDGFSQDPMEEAPDWYHVEAIQESAAELTGAGLPDRLMVDCSHANSSKDFRRQSEVLKAVASQVDQKSDHVMGVMIESHLVEGNQKINSREKLKYGQSITDSCIGWNETEEIILSLDEILENNL